MSIHEGLPPRDPGEAVALDLEILRAKPRQIHRPYGEFGLLTLSTGKDTWIIREAAQVEKALSHIRRARWVFHNASFDVRHLRRWAEVTPRQADHFWDTFLVEKILYGGWYGSFRLADLSRRHLGRLLEKETRKEFATASSMTPEMVRYALQDAPATLEIYKRQKKLMQADPLSLKVWEQIDAPAFWATLDFQGIYLDQKRLLALADAWQAEADELKFKLRFNPGSPKQVLQVLRRAGIPVPDTEEKTLLSYRESPLVAQVLKYREVSKRASTYGRNLLDFVEEDGRIYSEFHTIGAETGRTSCSDPNLQNQIKTDEYRACYRAARGSRMIKADYGSQEMRLSAQLSGDPELRRAFEIGEDIYTYVIRRVRNNSSIQRTDEKARRLGKDLALGLDYGLSEYGLSKNAGISLLAARSLISEYFHKFPDMKRYLDNLWGRAQVDLYVRTPGGRKVWINPYSHQARNNAYNAPMQGGGADMIKLALSRLHAQKKNREDFPIIGPIHDEILAEAPTRQARSLAGKITEAMLWAYQNLCPDVSTRGAVQVQVGPSWANHEERRKK